MSRDTVNASSAPKTKYLVLGALCAAHLFNDTFQSLIPAAFPLLKKELLLSFTQIGLIMTVFQLTSSICQPIIGYLTDKRPFVYALPCGMTSTLFGILLFSRAWSFPIVLLSVAMIGLGSAVFHPEAARLTYIAAGKRPGLAQSLFQTGGNIGTSIGPLLTALLITPYGRSNVAWFAVLVFCAILWMIPLSRWYRRRLKERRANKVSASGHSHEHSSRLSGRVFVALAVLLALLFSKNLYTVSLGTFFHFYLIERYHVSIEHAQLFVFAFLFASALGTMIGGPVGDKIGRKLVIWFSILGAAPFAYLLPYVDSLWATCVLSMLIGAILASSFPAIVIFAQELMPGRIGTVGGLFFGFSFGSAAIASALLGVLADYGGITFVYHLCALMPLIGLITWFLPNTPHEKERR